MPGRDRFSFAGKVIIERARGDPNRRCNIFDKHILEAALHCEPDGAFMPTSEDAAARIQLLQIHEPFAALAAGYAFEPEFFRFMHRL